MLDPEASWRHLRASRADPPGLAAAGARRRSYSAALEQAEQLWRAVDNVGESVSPILLYYCLTQGLQAALAARVPANGWRPRPSHGLRLHPVEVAEDAPVSLDDLKVQDEGAGYFQQIAELSGSASLPDITKLAAIVRSLPQAADLFVVDAAAVLPIEVMADDGINSFDHRKGGRAAAWLAPVPDYLVPESKLVNPTNPDELPDLAAVHEWLSDYPRLAAHPPDGVHQLIKKSEHFDPRQAQILVSWNGPDGEELTFQAEQALIREVVDYPTDGVSRKRAAGLVFPAVSPGIALHPLASWWTLLYATSMLARYEPNRWTRLLDLDRSPLAEGLSELLDLAHGEIPWLVAAQVFDVAPIDPS